MSRLPPNDGIMRYGTTRMMTLLGLILVPVSPGHAEAQDFNESQHYIDILQREHPEANELLLRLERAHGVLFGGLANRAKDTEGPTSGFESDMIARLTSLVRQDGSAEQVAEEAETGFATLGPRASAIIERGNSFHREVLGILTDPSLMGSEDRTAALAAAVQRYANTADALPSVPKNMDVLYDHPQALEFRTEYPDLDGLVWAGHWYELAATEPLTDLIGAERAAGLDTVRARYYSKLSFGEPPQSFPSEIPLAPAISPGLAYVSPETAIIWDNLSMLEEVLGDILAAPEVEDVQAAIDDAVGFFVAPDYGVTGRYDWQLMALRHGIFFQGGYPLTVMTKSERNAGGHMHGGGFVIVRGMGEG